MAEMLKCHLPDVSLATALTSSSSNPLPSNETLPQEPEFYPELIFVFNKVPESAFDPCELQCTQDTINAFFSHSKFQRTGFISSSIDEDPSQTGINNFHLPTDQRKFSVHTKFEGWNEDYDVLCERLRRGILSISREKTFQKIITEREWLRNCSKLWEQHIKKSTFISEFNRTMQKMGLYSK